MARNWTDAQKKAIESRDGSILVSAAAGSGKTAVLVERVIQRITDKDTQCPANALLIVTFTKAAASEMRDRIYSALKKMIRDDPNNEYLRKQEMLLADADICTMDSFCNSLVKENFRLLDISPDFKIIDASELLLLENEAIDRVLENEYEKNDKAFLDLAQLLFKNRDDSELAESIKLLYRYSRAYSFPNEWLDGICDGYNCDIPISESRWGKTIIDYALQATDYCLELNNEIETATYDDKVLYSAFHPTYISDGEYIENLKIALLNGEWDKSRALMDEKFKTRGRLPKGMGDDFTVKMLINKRDALKDTITKKIKPYFCVSEDEYKDDSAYFAPMMKKLVECVKLFGDELLKLKKEKNGYDFSDISHMALELLAEKNGESIIKTPLAEEISNRYTEVLIDEYQDTNEEQHILFNSISKNNENLFRVGDVKQSIYSFRQAMPDIFIALRNSLDEYTDGNYPAKISLDRNFRSRNGVTSFINFVFSQLMSVKAGGVNYSDGEALVPAANYADTDEPQAELHIIDMSSKENSELDSNVCQAKYVTWLIKDMMSKDIQVGRGDARHRLRYKDICILMRSVKSDRAVAYADEMRNWGIPCFTEVTGNFFSSSEILTVLSILRVIDNPNQDIPLLSALMSPIFAFTPDETAKLRISDRKSSLYACLLKNESENKKIADFLAFFRKMRFIAGTSTASELIRRILDETSFLAIVQAMEGGDIRRSNLMLLTDYAEIYENSGMIGLSGFIRFIDKLFINKKELDASNPVSENADVVRIMTIHKSKGLEFPVCILASADKKFNAQDEKKSMIIDPKNGVGIIRREETTMAKYETLSHKSAKLQMNLNSKSEEMRILYVAMTRAEEKLIAVTSLLDASKAIATTAEDIDISKKTVSPFSVLNKNSYSEWLLKSAIRHPDAYELRRIADLGEEYVLDCDGRLNVKIIDKVKSYHETLTDISNGDEIDETLQKLIYERVNFEYKYAKLSSVTTKRAASELDGNALDMENFATTKPNFLSGGNMTATEKGTATHKFMQYADFECAEKDVEAEAERLVQLGKLTTDEEKSIRFDEVKGFFASSLYSKIKTSANVFREKKFTVNLPAEKVYPELQGDLNEDIMIQGMIDCAFEENGKLIVVDYKTDRISDETVLSKRYSRQLNTYKYALEQITGLEVEKAYVYSFKLSKTIEIF